MPPPPPPLPPPLPARAGDAAAAPSGARYVIAAIAGVAFALVVGGLCVAIWLSMRAHPADVASTPAATVRAPAAIAAPTVTDLPVATAAVTALPVPSSAPSVAPTPAVASVAPATIDVSDSHGEARMAHQRRRRGPCPRARLGYGRSAGAPGESHLRYARAR